MLEPRFLGSNGHYLEISFGSVQVGVPAFAFGAAIPDQVVDSVDYIEEGST